MRLLINGLRSLSSARGSWAVLQCHMKGHNYATYYSLPNYVTN